MLAILYLLLAIGLGASLCRFAGLTPARIFQASRRDCSAPALFFYFPAALTVGLLPLTVLTYILASWSDLIWPAAVYPLLPANLAAAALSSGLIAVLNRHPARPDPAALPPAQIRKPRPARQISAWLPYVAGSLFILLVAWLLSFAVFKMQDGWLGAGYSVFSDYAPHTALISSFSQGRNFNPTTYPHFTGDGIRYHFFFYFLCGNLQYLGLPIDWALNLPSFLGSVAALSLLGWLSVRLSGRAAAFMLTPFLIIFRSSLAGWSYFSQLADSARSQGLTVWKALWQNQVFPGTQLHDDWGLWNLNVFANQRHLLLAFTAGLMVLLSFLPLLQPEAPFVWRGLKAAWTGPTRAARRQTVRNLVPAWLILLCLPFWHGSVLVIVLLLLLVMALFSRGKLFYLLAAGLALGSGVLTARIFSGSENSVAPSFYWGFLAEDKSLGGVLSYLWYLWGLAGLLYILQIFCQPTRLRRVLAAAVLLPVLPTFTLSLTPDITVNHKYLIMSSMLATVFLSDLLLRLAARLKAGLKSPKLSRRGLAGAGAAGELLLFLALTCTGLPDLTAYINKNRSIFWIDSKSSLTVFAQTQTDPRDIFLTPAWHYNAFFLSGRQVWYGHSYYASSAGHDTATRWQEVLWLWRGADGDLAAYTAYVRANGIRYCVINDELRQDQDIALNESFFADNFELVAAFPEDGNMLVYKLW